VVKEAQNLTSSVCFLNAQTKQSPQKRTFAMSGHLAFEIKHNRYIIKRDVNTICFVFLFWLVSLMGENIDQLRRREIVRRETSADFQ
jgi:hypothetical protein